MNTYGLTFISDEDLFSHVLNTVKKYKFNIDLKAFNKNLIDPIKLTFDAKIYGKTVEELIDSEVIRQIDRSNSNLIGYFQQNIFNYIGEGWTVPKTGYDIVNEDLLYFVEMKNKHNTMNSSSSQKTFMRMQNTLLQTPDATCMLVEVIAKKSQNINWKISLDGKSIENERIKRVSIDKFYELVTGEAEAFKNLCEVLPSVIADAVNSLDNTTQSNTVFEELQAISPNLLKSIYLLSFQKYEGFHQLDV